MGVNECATLLLWVPRRAVPAQECPWWSLVEGQVRVLRIWAFKLLLSLFSDKGQE